jgi:hypothetical protein
MKDDCMRQTAACKEAGSERGESKLIRAKEEKEKKKEEKKSCQRNKESVKKN